MAALVTANVLAHDCVCVPRFSATPFDLVAPESYHCRPSIHIYRNLIATDGGYHRLVQPAPAVDHNMKFSSPFGDPPFSYLTGDGKLHQKRPTPVSQRTIPTFAYFISTYPPINTSAQNLCKCPPPRGKNEVKAISRPPDSASRPFMGTGANLL